MKSGKEDLLFSQLLVTQESGDDDEDLLSILLRDLLEQDKCNVRVGLQATLNRVAGLTSPAVHGYVNRLLAILQKPNTVVKGELTSHSFQRGGAQHANGSSDWSARWILDRGSWSMSSTNKGFQYVLNTTQEDQQVAKYLSGWHVRANAMHNDLSAFDSVVLSKIREVAQVLFSGCEGLDSRVCDVLMATLLRNFPPMAKLQTRENLGFVARVPQCIGYCDVSESEFLSWHNFIIATSKASIQTDSTNIIVTPEKPKSSLASVPPVTKNENEFGKTAAFERLVAELLGEVRRLGDRVQILEKVIEPRGLTPTNEASLQVEIFLEQRNE